MDNVRKALEAQRKRRSDIQSASDARKASAIQKRKSSLVNPNTSVKSSTSNRYTKDGSIVGANKIFSRTDSGGMQNFGKKVASAINSQKTVKSPVSKGPSISQRRAAESARPVVSKAQIEKSRPSIGSTGLSKSAPKSINVTPSRTYTDKEKQINALLMTGKKKNGTLKSSAQRKIQKIRRK